MTPRTRRLALVATGLAACTAMLAAEALATPPGKDGRIAFLRAGTPDGENGSIFTLGANGKLETRVTRPPVGASDFQPDWSPDGSRIAFERGYSDKPFEV